MNAPDTARKLHHFGFVVADIEAGMAGFVRSLAGEWDGRIYEDSIQKVRVAFLATGSDDPHIELVQPNVEASPVSRFLREKGGGFHHVCYEVADLEGHMREMKARGALIVNRPKPAVAFGGRRIAWMLTAEGMLVELLERDSGLEL